jgi:opacity protein-like surface antigen
MKKPFGLVKVHTLLFAAVGPSFDRIKTSITNPPAAGSTIVVGNQTIVLAPGYATSKSVTKTGIGVGLGVEKKARQPFPVAC